MGGAGGNRIVVDDDSFVFVGGRIALDFVNTEGMADGALVDRVPTDLAVSRWARAAGLPVKLEGDAATRHADVGTLRGAAREVFESLLAERPPAEVSLATINRVLAWPRPAPRLRARDGGFARVPRPLDVPGVLQAVAEDVAELLCGDDRERIRGCEHDDCVLLFVDRSRQGGRRWCSMKLCGNRAKAAAHRRRNRN